MDILDIELQEDRVPARTALDELVQRRAPEIGKSPFVLLYIDERAYDTCEGFGVMYRHKGE